MTTAYALIPFRVIVGIMMVPFWAGCTTGDGDPTQDTGSTRDTQVHVTSDAGDPEPDTGNTDANGVDTSAQLLIAFAANFDSDQRCQKMDGDGCDIYLASLTSSTLVVNNVTRLTSAKGTRESFPTIDRSGRFVLYEHYEKKVNTIEFVTVDGKQSAALLPGRYPDFAHTDDRFAFSTDDRKITVARYRQDGDRLELLDSKVVGTGRDPQFFPDGQRLIFHYQPKGEQTRTALLSLSNNAVTDLSDPNDCAHSSVNLDGTVATCGRLGKSWFRKQEADQWTPMALLIEPESPSTYGPRFAECGMVGYGFIEFCGDNDTVVLNAICEKRGERVFTNLFLVRLSTGTLVDLHDKLQQRYGVSGKDSYTASCR